MEKFNAKKAFLEALNLFNQGFEFVEVVLHDENGHFIKKSGVVIEILEGGI